MNNSRYFELPGSNKRYDRNIMLAVVLVALAMALLQVSSVNNTLPVIQDSIGASSSASQWVLSGYALATGIMLVPAGRIGDIFGQSVCFVAGLSVFALSSIGCGLVSDAMALNVMRVFQGLGAGIFSPQVTGLIQNHFQARVRARAFGFLGLVIAMSVATGPVLSGSFVSWLGPDLGWRWSFLINGPLGVVGVIAAARYLPFASRRDTRSRVDLDPLGMILLCLAVVAIMLPFMTQVSWRWLLLLAGVVLVAAWVAWELLYKKRGHLPMVDLDLFTLPSLSYSTAISAFQFLGTTSIFVILAMCLQSGLDVSALTVGLIGLPNALLSGWSAVWAGNHAYERGKQIMVWSMGLVAVSLALTIATAWFVFRGAPVALLTLPLMPAGLGLGAMGAANLTQAMFDVPPSQGGTAGGLLQTVQRVCTAIGIAVVTGIFFTVLGGNRTTHAWFSAFAAGTTVIIVFVLLAMVTAIAFLRCRPKTPATA
ncbi:MAG: MFS transporter [Actinomycetaceae bacterium]|nr:MFS transporter [Actinomycetaceae bacterium]